MPPPIRASAQGPPRPLRLSWSDERVRGIVWQVLVVGLIGAVDLVALAEHRCTT
jgi:general L-amino acid transport system permease protein